ncbi:Collagen alpha-1(V) chain [Bulinus truncatus]|nr:Collagen alpha-1(V) chain [Bulinus truncatus]
MQVCGVDIGRGWDDWSTWTACNAGCSVGQQIRTRTCPKSDSSLCIGVPTEVRTCNLFPCEDSYDLLTLMGVRELPMGVTASSNRSNTYQISKHAKLSLSVSKIYDLTFPPTFSLLTRVRVSGKKSRSFFFVVSDIQGKQQLALFLGKKLKLQYLGNNYVFRMDIVEGAWHSIAVSVDRTTVTLYADCQQVFRKRLRSREEFLGTNLMMSIGPYFSQYGGLFEGEVEQLVLSSDPEVAQQQCGLIQIDREYVTAHVYMVGSALMKANVSVLLTILDYIVRMHLALKDALMEDTVLLQMSVHVHWDFMAKDVKKFIVSPDVRMVGSVSHQISVSVHKVILETDVRKTKQDIETMTFYLHMITRRAILI